MGGFELNDQLLDPDVPTLASQDKLKVSPKGLPFVNTLPKTHIEPGLSGPPWKSVKSSTNQWFSGSMASSSRVQTRKVRTDTTSLCWNLGPTQKGSSFIL